MAIRWRLTLWFSLILLVIMVFTGIVLDTLLSHYLYSEVDQNLESHLANVHGTIHGSPGSPVDYNVIHSNLPPINEFASPGIYIELIDASGKVVVKSDNLVNQDLPADPELIQTGIAGNTDVRTVAAGDGTNVRIMVSPLYLQDQTLVLEIAQSLKPVEGALKQFRLALIFGITTALILTGILGALIVRRTLDPVENITRTASNIEESSNLSRRVGYTGPRDEIGRLAVTFDRMLERLKRTFDSQKNFIADASHELRTPLTVIRGNLDLMKRNISEEDRKESLQAIEAETTRMTRIANDLLLLAEIESTPEVKQENVSLPDLIMEEARRAQQMAGNRKIVLDRAENLQVKGDYDKLKQVAGNLLDNAIKYTPDDGVITLSLFQDGNWARLDVTDTGIGISQADLPHLFDRFYRVNKARSRKGGGTGLGLAIVKGIVEQQGGHVDVASVEGNGSTFSIWLKL